jgi:hypothetical protein
MPGWAAAALLRPLPSTVRPVRDETLESYLWRLANANGLNPHYFTMYVKGSKKPKAPIPPDAVIKLSGQPANSMRYAILELCTPQELYAPCSESVNDGTSRPERPKLRGVTTFRSFLHSPARSSTLASCVKMAGTNRLLTPTELVKAKVSALCVRPAQLGCIWRICVLSQPS